MESRKQMKTLVTIVALVAATTANAGTTIKNIIDTETNLLIGQTWTDNESGSTDYVYVDKTDRQLFVVNQGRYKELVKTKKYGATTDTVKIYMGDMEPMVMSTEVFIAASGTDSFKAAVQAYEDSQNGKHGTAGDDHHIEREIKTPVDRQSSMKLTPAMVAKLNAKIKQYNESE